MLLPNRSRQCDELRWGMLQETINYWLYVGLICVAKIIDIYIIANLANFKVKEVVRMELICFVGFLEIFISMIANILTSNALPT